METRERYEIIQDYIKGEMLKRGISVKDIADTLSISAVTVYNTIRSNSCHRKTKIEIIRLIKCDPWKLYPPQPYRLSWVNVP